MAWSGHDVFFFQPWHDFVFVRFTFFVVKGCFFMHVVHTAIAQFNCVFVHDFVNYFFLGGGGGGGKQITGHPHAFISYVGG